MGTSLQFTFDTSIAAIVAIASAVNIFVTMKTAAAISSLELRVERRITELLGAYVLRRETDELLKRLEVIEARCVERAKVCAERIAAGLPCAGGIQCGSEHERHTEHK